MADPLSTTASVAGLRSLAIQLSQLSFQYVASIKGSSKAWSSYIVELLTLTSVLLKAQQASDAAGNFSIISPSSISPSAMQECQAELSQLKAILSEKLQKQGLRGKLEMLAWPFSESETEKRVQALHRFSALISSSLVADNLSFAMANYCHLQEIKHVGCGKTHLVATIVNDIVITCPNATHLSQPTSVSKLAEKLYTKSKPTKSPVLVKELVKILCDIGSSSGRTYVILDGVDEFPHYSKLLKHLPEFTAAGIRVLVSSRDLPTIQSPLSGAMVFDARAGGSDIQAYVSWRLAEDSELDDDVFTAGLKEEICRKLIEHVKGSFLLCRLMMDRICSATTVKSLRTKLQTLPSSHEDVYTDTLNRIHKQELERRDLANHALSWVCVCVRPLDMAELRHAVASLDPDGPSYNNEDLATEKSILSSCLGMLIATRGGGNVELVQSSARQFVVKRLRLHDQATQLGIGKACLKYMSTTELSKGVCTSILDSQTRLRRFPFLDYAARHYGAHVRPVEDGMLSELLTFLNDGNLRFSSWQLLHFVFDIGSKSAEEMFDSVPRGASSIHVACYWGFSLVLKRALGAASSSSHHDMLDSQDSHGWTGLHWATSAGHEGMVKILLDAGAKMEVVDQGGWTPLFWAALKGHAPILRLLLSWGADAFRADNGGMTPLHWSVLSGAQEVTTLLLDHAKEVKPDRKRPWEVDPDKPPRTIGVEQAKRLRAPQKFRNVFEVAAKRGDVEGFAQLAASFDEYGWRGYQEAGLNVRDFDNVWDRAKVVMSKREGRVWRDMAATSPVDAVRCRLLTSAIQCEDIQMVKSILDLSMDMGKDLSREVVTRLAATYVHVAAYSGSAEIMQMLIEQGLPLDVVDVRGMTPLHYACRTGTFQVVDIILRTGVKADARMDKSGLTPLMVLLQFGAWRTRNSPGETTKIIQALVAHGASVNTKDSSGCQAIHYAVLSYDSTVINALLDLSADPGAMANGLITPLHVLARGYCWSVWESEELELEGFHQKKYQHFRYNVPPHAKRATSELIIRVSPEGSLAAVTDDGNSALGLAIQARNWVVAQALHRVGASFIRGSQQLGGSSSCHSETIDEDLDKASEEGFHELAGILRRRGAKPRDRELLPNIAAMVPAQKPHRWTRNLSGLEEGLEHFPLRDHAKVVRDLTSAGAISDHKSDYLKLTGVQLAADRGVDGELLSALLDGGSDPYSETDEGLDSFQLALVCGKDDNLKILLDYADADGSPRDHWIANWLRKRNSNSWTSTFDACLPALQDADLIGRWDNNGHTLLFRAVQRGNKALVSELLKLGANPRATDWYGWGPIHEAVRTENVELVELLVDWGAYIFDTVFDVSAYSLTSPSSTLLSDELEAAVINVLHIAVGVNPHPMDLEERAKLSPGMVRLLLNLGLDPNQQTRNTAALGSWGLKQAETPLQIMFRDGRFTWDDKFFEVVKMLIDAGADPNGIADNMSIDNIADFEGHEDLWELFRVAGTEGPMGGNA